MTPGVHGGTSPRRVWRFAAAVAVLGSVAAAAVGGIGLDSDRPAAHAQEAPAAVLKAAHDASFVPRLSGDRPLFILAMGSDARPGQDVSGQRADSIHLVGIDRARQRATILGFPRDSWVPIPGHGSGKINSAMTLGGPQLVVRTVEQLTGITIDYWVLTWFQAFDQAVDAIGGLTVNVPYAMNDDFSHANLKKGVQELKGWQALALARNRHDTPNGDFSRSANQGLLILSALKQLRSEFQADPARLLTYIVAGWRNVETDLKFATILDLAMTVSQIDPAKVNRLVLRGYASFVGNSSVVLLFIESRSVFEDMRKDGIVDHPPPAPGQGG